MRQAAARSSMCSLARTGLSEWADGNLAGTVRMWPEQPHIWAQCRNLRPWPAGDQPGTQNAEDAPVSKAGDDQGLDLPWGVPASGAPACSLSSPVWTRQLYHCQHRNSGEGRVGVQVQGPWGVYASPSLGLFRTIPRRPGPLSSAPSHSGQAPSLASYLHGKISSP